ncbi:hypothetical protein VP01_3717g2 [Puccinia sorghi]|uniref:Uncharacterized protein n=1 Tax=Puccinia sorghi TaxID=27349 RepID=A0A0L6UU19_9BASI|nr:hypothetical protein VP01_3717g2 [Puccinia sorghi]
MRPYISMSSIRLLLVVMTGLASYASAYTCTISPFVKAACMKINYETGGLQGTDHRAIPPSVEGSRPGAPNLDIKFGCGNGFINTPVCCSKVSMEIGLILRFWKMTSSDELESHATDQPQPFQEVQAGTDGSLDPNCIFAPQGPDKKLE